MSVGTAGRITSSRLYVHAILSLTSMIYACQGQDPDKSLSQPSSSNSTKIAHIISLPQDILYLIFLNTLPSEVTIFGASVSFENVSPINLFAVCRSWHSIVLSRPSLWSIIHVIHGSECRRYYDDPLNLPSIKAFKGWLKRTQRSPMDICLELSQVKNEQVYKGVLDLFVPQIGRCTDIDVRVECCGVFAALHGRPAPVIFHCPLFAKSVKIAFRDLEQAEPPITWASLDLASCMAGDATSQLQVLELSFDVNCVFPESKAELHLPHLRELSLQIDISDHRAVDDLFALLSASSILSKFTLKTRGDFTGSTLENGMSRSISLSTLTDFTFTFSNLAFAEHLLLSLVCPELRTCSLNIETPIDGDTSHFLRIIARFFSCHGTIARPPLVDLCLRFSEEPEDTATEPAVHSECSISLMKILSRVCYLERLRMFELEVQPNLIHAMTVLPGSDGSDVLCTKLSKLEVGRKAGYVSMKELLQEMKASRSASSTPMTELKVNDPAIKVPKVIDSEYIDDGFVVF
ncbi:hypothetical protein SCHPADRAFT_502184 [Schizopora paradoxa]|uniref:Uncharacterized protein n=1 Tax=Schizopora paradoxa TaxID=27342 RepID=A0A0H2RG10_9AGAM|nr:hypothetical protein SCHPADRAFT_502184 [Schizopora paradoxa]